MLFVYASSICPRNASASYQHLVTLVCMVLPGMPRVSPQVNCLKLVQKLNWGAGVYFTEGFAAEAVVAKVDSERTDARRITLFKFIIIYYIYYTFH